MTVRIDETIARRLRDSFALEAGRRGLNLAEQCSNECRIEQMGVGTLSLLRGSEGDTVNRRSVVSRIWLRPDLLENKSRTKGKRVL